MKKYLIAACTLLLATNVHAEDLNDQYPKTREEKQAEEMGSVLGGEGIVVRPGGISAAEGVVPAEGSFNKFLWQASQEVADVAPLALIDGKNGVFSTDWYSPKDAPNTSMKMTVKVTGKKLSEDSLEVKLHQKTMKNGRWVEEDAKSKIATDMKAKILKRARELSASGK